MVNVDDLIKAFEEQRKKSREDNRILFHNGVLTPSEAREVGYPSVIRDTFTPPKFENKVYISYTSPKILDDFWYDVNCTGRICVGCGLSDAPTIRTEPKNEFVCRYCCETTLLSWHINSWHSHLLLNQPLDPNRNRVVAAFRKFYERFMRMVKSPSGADCLMLDIIVIAWAFVLLFIVP